MIMEGSKLLPDPEGQSKPEHDLGASATRTFEGLPAAFTLQRTASGPDADQRRAASVEREKREPGSLCYPSLLVEGERCHCVLLVCRNFGRRKGRPHDKVSTV